MRVAWLTDLHLDHATDSQRDALYAECQASTADGFLITGDIATGPLVCDSLRELGDVCNRPLYFVLGNHDFYNSRMDRVRREVSDLCGIQTNLHYLTDQFSTALSENVGLVGEDGWGDGTEGDYENSTVRLSDFALIEDFAELSPDQWKDHLRALGAESEDRLRPKLQKALERFATVIVATHVPPYREACWYEGHTTDDNWAPFFVCGQMGNLLTEMALEHPARRIVVFCGHTHHPGMVSMTDNLTVVTGGAHYGAPGITGILEIGSAECLWRVNGCQPL